MCVESAGLSHPSRDEQQPRHATAKMNPLSKIRILFMSLLLVEMICRVSIGALSRSRARKTTKLFVDTTKTFVYLPRRNGYANHTPAHRRGAGDIGGAVAAGAQHRPPGL